MLPLLALTYTAARLGFEAQSAAAFRLLRVGTGIAKATGHIVPEPTVRFADIAPAPIPATQTRRPAAKRVLKKSAPVGNGASSPSGLSAARIPLPTAPTLSRRPNSSETAPWSA
jgi:hypothetical protein